MTPHQRGVLAALQIGAPGVARVYQAICEAPGLNLQQIKVRCGCSHVSERVLRLERAGLVISRRPGEGKSRLCFPVEAP